MGNEPPRVSIGVPVFNGDKYLREVLCQLVCQDYPHIELILSDNASTDGTEAICRELAASDSRVRYHRQPTNLGGRRNWEFVLEQATGPYFMWAAHDDEWSLNAVSSLVNALEDERDAVLAFPENLFINDQREQVIDCSHLPELAGPLPLLQRVEHVMWFEEGAQKANIIHGLMRTDAIRRVGLSTFDEWGGDQVIILGMALEGYFVYVPEAQFYKRYLPGRCYDNDDLVGQLGEMRVYFELQRQLIDNSRLDSLSKELLLVSLSARETTWYCRVMNAKNTTALRANLSSLIACCDAARDTGSKIHAAPAAPSLETTAEPREELTSIVILNFNGRPHLQQCLESIAKYTPQRHEVIVFDNASTDGSREYLRELSNVTLVESPVNLGCPPGRAQALSLARGDFVVLLDNDTMVTPAWLRRFRDHMRANPEIGMLGPRSNHVSGTQLVANVAYSSQFELVQFAKLWSWKAERIQCLVPTRRLVGFCMCVRHAVIDKIGGFDARFGKFGFEDDDFTLRSVVAGYRAMIANDVFIHHTGGPQTRGDAEYNLQLAEAWMAFKQKWGIPQSLACGEPYDVDSIFSQAFDPTRHYVPIPDAADIAHLIYRPAAPKLLPWQDSSHPHVFSKRSLDRPSSRAVEGDRRT